MLIGVVVLDKLYSIQNRCIRVDTGKVQTKKFATSQRLAIENSGGSKKTHTKHGVEGS